MGLRITPGFSPDTFQFTVQVGNSRKERMEVREAEEAGGCRAEFQGVDITKKRDL